MDALAVKVQGLLQGEPLRLIVYGAAVVVWLATRIAPPIAAAFGITLNFAAINLDSALLTATAAAAALTEIARRFVYSPNTVAAVATTSAVTGVPQVPPPPSSSDEVIAQTG